MFHGTVSFSHYGFQLVASILDFGQKPQRFHLTYFQRYLSFFILKEIVLSSGIFKYQQNFLNL